MTMRFIQGFEQFKPTSVAEDHILPAEVSQYLGFAPPTNITDWFLDGDGEASNASGPLVQSSDVNIDGQALIIKRPNSGATHNPSYNGKFSLDLTQPMNANRTNYVGFALKLSQRPSVPVPLVQFNTSDGITNSEQCSLWLGTSGELFFSSVDFDITSETIITPALSGSFISGVQAFNFTTWNYIEVLANFAANPNALTVAVNGVNVIDGLTGISANKTARGETTSISIVNCPNTYYPGDSYDMYLDDIYFGDAVGGGITTKTGPQHIILLEPATTVQNEWTIEGGAASSNLAVDGTFDKSDVTDYLTNATASDEEIFSLDDLPASVVAISAIQVGAFMNVDAGSATVALKIIEGADTEESNVLVNSTDITFYKRIFENDAGDDNWTVSALNSTNLAIEVT